MIIKMHEYKTFNVGIKNGHRYAYCNLQNIFVFQLASLNIKYKDNSDTCESTVKQLVSKFQLLNFFRT